MATDSDEDVDAPVLVTVDDGVMTLVLNRPDARNAMNEAMVRALLAALDRAGSDGAIRVVIVTGAGSVFCSGADLKEMRDGAATSPEQRVDVSIALYSAFPALPIPVIAAVNGHAAAGGCGLAMAADFVLSSDSAQFWYPEVTKGLVPGIVLVRLAALVGARVALDLLLTGRRMSAVEAQATGLVTRVVPAADLLSQAHGLARELVANDRAALATTKSLFNRVHGQPAKEGLELAREVSLTMRRNAQLPSAPRAAG